MARKRTPQKDGLTAPQRAFLAAYAETGCITYAAKAADAGRRTHYNWLESSEAYAAAFEDADEIATEALEKEARRRAIEGVRRLKFDRGSMVVIPCEPGDPEGRKVADANPEAGAPEVWVKPYVEHEYSDTLLIFLLKGKRPEVYRERVEARHTGKVEHAHSGGVTVYLPDNQRHHANGHGKALTNGNGNGRH